jgi:outer membrane protein assembly factor BamD (BamD/ComL family)
MERKHKAGQGGLRRGLAGLGLLGLLGMSAVAQAQSDEMTFGTEETSSTAEATDSALGKFLEEGLKYYEAKDYYQASLLFYKVIETQDPSADRLKPKAQYELAKSLYRLDFHQGALNQFDLILEQGEGHPYYEASLSWLILLSRKLPGDPNLLTRVNKFAGYFPDRVPDKFRDEFAFLLGRHYYQEADLEQSLKFMKYVGRDSEYFTEAKFYEGITHVRRFEAEPAVSAFKELLGFLSEQDLDDPAIKHMEQLVLITMARAFYSVGQYETSVKYYGFVGQDSEYWLDGLFEESWAYFQTDKFNKALGNLHTLNSPFFEDTYFPESMILQAVVFFTNCQYDRVRLTIEEFNLVYPELLKQLEEYLAQYQDPTELYEFLVKINDGKETFDPRINQILSAALTDKTLKRTIGYNEALKEEEDRLSKTSPSWRDSSLGKTLQQDLTVSQSFALNDAGSLAKDRLERVVRELKDLDKQSKKILIETANAEADSLDQSLRDEQFAAQDVKGPQRPEVDEEHIYWSFRGEYWRDELGYYLYNIGSKCGR